MIEADTAMTIEFLAQMRKGFSEFENKAVKLSNPAWTGMSCWVLNWPVTSKAAEIIQTKGNMENEVTISPTM